METHTKVFVADTNYTLIMRLRQNVIRAGLRNISLAYSKIALSDVAKKLALGTRPQARAGARTHTHRLERSGSTPHGCTTLGRGLTPPTAACPSVPADHPEDMESIAAKAIRDGVIDATVDHAAGVLLSKEATDVYSTLEPQAAFHKRITFCLHIHNDAVKAMSYPPDAHKDELPDAETIKERQREEQELADALAEEDYE